MEIVAINKSRSPQKVWLKFSDGRLLPFSIDDVVVYKLAKFKNLDLEEFTKIEVASIKFLLREYCLRQIAVSPKTEILLSRKLNQYSTLISRKYGYPKKIIQDHIPQTVSYFVSQELLNPLDYVNYIRRRFPSRSTVELNHRLRQAGVDIKIESRPEDEITAIRKLLETKYRSRDLSDYKSRSSVISSLYRRGFALNNIKNAIDEYLCVG